MNRQAEYFRWGTTETLDELGAALAEIFLMNYDDENKVLYCGDDKNNGLKISASAQNAFISFAAWCNGATIGGGSWSTQPNDRVLAYFINDVKTAVAFGYDANNIVISYSTTINSDGETGYLFAYVNTGYNGFTGVYGQNLYYSTFNNTSRVISNTRLLVIAPITLIEENTAIATDAYIKITGDPSDYALSKIVSMNGEDYLLTVGSNQLGAQPVIHLGKS